MKKIFDLLKRWYNGEIVLPESKPLSKVLHIGYSYRRHWTARVVRKVIKFQKTVINFHKKQWKWALSFYVGLIGLIITIML